MGIKSPHTPSPQLVSFPPGTARRLIDNGLLQYEASMAGFAERYGRGETSHTIHVWWARRPHTAMRALVFASVCKESDRQEMELMSELCRYTSVPESILKKARNLIHGQYGRPPKILDMFGGGGTIPFEALNLGAEAYSIDANELSVFIQKCNLIYSQNVDFSKITGIIEASGRRVLKQLTDETAQLFPLREPILLGHANTGITNYLWTYSTFCQKCGFRFFLSKRPWLSRKNGKYLALSVWTRGDHQDFIIKKVSKDYKHPLVWTGKNKTIQCPKCGEIKGGITVADCKDELVVLIRSVNGKGKEFLPIHMSAVPTLDVLREMENKLLDILEIELPQSILPNWSGIVNPALYGIKTHADFLNPRQRLVLLFLIKALIDEYGRLQQKESDATSKFVTSVLSSMVDQIVDWNCRLSMWISQNEQVGRAFCGPGVPMLWDYVESDPVLFGPANLWGKLQRIIEGVRSIKAFPAKGHVKHAYSQSLPYGNEYFDAIVTDPPYYDNLYYSIMADFFFAWKRLLLAKVDQKLFEKEATDMSHELVASVHRKGEKAHEDYCRQLGHAIQEATRVLVPDGVLSFIYSHSSLKGWEALIRAFRPTKLQITSVQPLSIERKQRPRAMTSEAVNTCITFVAHKGDGEKPATYLDRLTERLRSIRSSEFLTALQTAGWQENDVAIALFAQGVGLMANTEKVLDCESDEQALMALEKIVKEKFPTFKVQKRRSL